MLNSTPCENFLTFGQWLKMNDTLAKTALLEMKGGQNLSDIEMSGLYGVLRSDVLLGSKKETFLDDTIVDFCDTNIESFKLPQLIMGYNIHFDSKLGIFVEDNVVIQCGLIHWLETYRSRITMNNVETSMQESDHTELLLIIQQYLCLNTSLCCMNITHEQPWKFEYLSAIVDYIYDYLLPFAFHKSVISTNTDIIITRKQRDLALGYFYALNSSGTPFTNSEADSIEDKEEDITEEDEGNSSSYEESQQASEMESEETFEPVDKVFVQGILEDVCCEENVPKQSKHITLLTCYDQINAQSNFKWHGK